MVRRPRSAAGCGDDGIWLHGEPAEPGTPLRPALFLDRDGTVVEEVGHLRRPEDVRLIEGAAAVIARANALAIPVIVVTNQSGIGRGLFGWAELIAVEERIEAELSALGAWIDAVLACPFHPEGRPPYRHPDHWARKPNPGLLLRAADAFAIEFASSWIVGDRAGDIAAGRAARLAGGMHVASGWGSEPGEREAALACAGPSYRVLEAVTIAETRDLLPASCEPGSGNER
ncbi:MAG: HAD-IIIA family hydrolase [Rhodospirillales bacterium]|nr:HAD-IIIA family hydrolase [Rhodospirillales bacterium]